jgi:hypothetical protein
MGMAIGKRLRFEIFKRDGFKCVYCGATPMATPLHVDHVEPKAGGGSDDPSNLVTACASCNLGKSDVPLDRKRLKAVRVSEADEDHAEQIRAFLSVQREVARAKDLVVQEVLDHWFEMLGAPSDQMRSQMSSAVERNGIDKVFEAISITSRNPKLYSATAQAKYFYGILRRMREEAS